MFFVLIAIFIIVSLILPWVNLSRIITLEKENREIRALLSNKEKAAQPPIIDEGGIVKKSQDEESFSTISEPDVGGIKRKITEIYPHHATSTIPLISESPKEKKVSFEQRFGKRLPVWIGGIALAFAGLFMVKYSIDAGILTAGLRVILGVAFGIALLGLGKFIHSHKDFANKEKISQAFVGAGLVDLYACVFVAVNIYHFISPAFGFGAMILITVLAIILSLSFGIGVALFAFIGGFLTPVLVSSQEPNGAMLFVYLYLILTGLFFLIRQKNWWILGIPAILASFLWVAIWMATGFAITDSMYLGLFLIAICSTVTFISKTENEAIKVDKSGYDILHYLTFAGSALLMALLAKMNNFGLLEWGFFGLLAIGSIVLAGLKPKIYGFAPRITLIVSIAMLLTANASNPTQLFTIIAAFFILYIGAGYSLMWRSQSQILWALIVGLASVGYFLVGFFKLKNVLIPEDIFNGNWIWSGLALLFSAMAACVVRKINVNLAGEEKIRQNLLAIFTITSTTFFSLAIAIFFEIKLWPIAVATQVLVISWINNKVDISALRKIAMFLSALFALLIFREIIAIVDLALNSVIKSVVNDQYNLTMIKNPLIYFGIPALEFVVAGLFFSKQKTDDFVKWLEVAAASLFLVTTYYFIRNSFNPGANILAIKAGFIERGVVTAAFCLFGILCLCIQKIFNKTVLLTAGILVLILVLLRVFYFDLLIYNPINYHDSVGSIYIFNALLLAFGLPLIALFLINKDLADLKDKSYFRYNNIVILIMSFALLSLNIRQIYHGEYLDQGATTNAETYTYSVMWLLLGIGLLFGGTIKKNKMLRVSALCLIIMTVIKVFFYDASELTGLYRVFSFLGLGFSLIGLSWFYTKYISDSSGS
jgi:uncharacterized membrane protein